VELPYTPKRPLRELHTEFSIENYGLVADFALLCLYEKLKLEIMSNSAIGA